MRSHITYMVRISKRQKSEFSFWSEQGEHELLYKSCLLKAMEEQKETGPGSSRRI